MESGDAATAEATGISTAGPDRRAGVGGRPGERRGGSRRRSQQARLALARAALSRAALLTLAAGLLITAVLAVAALELYNHNETRLLKLRARELSLVLSTAVPTLQTPLASAAELADATGGNAQKFRAFMTPLVGTGGRVHLRLAVARGAARGWHRRSSSARGRRWPRTRGSQQAVRRGRGRAVSWCSRACSPGRTPRLGYAYAVPGAHGGLVVYAENPLPASRRSQLAESTGFGDLNYALYLGRSRQPQRPAGQQHHPLPDHGPAGEHGGPVREGRLHARRHARALARRHVLRGPPVADRARRRDGLDGGGVLTERVVRRRRRRRAAGGVLDRVASENRQMYTQQRGIAQTLQHALLPETLPADRRACGPAPATCRPPRGSTWAETGTTSSPSATDSALLLIGDVSGHGLRAATTMASLRHAALAYASEDSSPASVLSKLSNFVNTGSPDYFATMLCARVDVAEHRITLASAGHLPPLLIAEGEARLLEFDPDVAIGVARDWEYRETEVEIPPRAILVAYTDGLVERRGELLDVGLERLRRVALDAPPEARSAGRRAGA